MRVSREFKANFDLVAKHYRLAELGELDESKEAVRRDPEGAAQTFAEMGALIRRMAVLVRTESRLPTITPEEIDARTRQIQSATRKSMGMRGVQEKIK